MLKATLKSLLSRKLRLVLSALAVVLGVMFVSGSFVLTDTLGKSFDGLFSSAFSAVDVQVAPKSKPADNGQSVDTVPASVVDTVKSVSGVKKAEGQVFADGARVLGKTGKVIPGSVRFGTNWIDGAAIVEMREGTSPKADDEIAINKLLADASGYKVGDTVPVLTLFEPKKTYKIAGIFGYTGARDSLLGEQTVAFTTKAAQENMLGKTGVFNSVQLQTDAGVKPETVRDELRTKLGDAYAVKTGKELTKESGDSIKEGLKFFNYILLGFAAVSLLVGVFLIVNTFSIIVAQRTRELALMRALGASGSQVITSVIIEAIVIGLIASILGLGAGIGIGALLVKLVGSTFGGISLGTLTVPASAIIAAFSVGILVTLVAAVVPAVRASRIPPIAAMRDAVNVSKPLTKLSIFGGVVTALGVAGLWWALSGSAKGGNLGLALGGGLLLSFVGVALLTPLVGKPIVSLLALPFAWSMPGKLGRGNSARNPRRTAITAAALMIGIALITGVSVVLTSLKATITKSLDTGMSAELIVSGEQTGPTPPTFEPSALPKIKSIAGVHGVTGVYFDQAEANDKTVVVGVFTDVPAAVEMFKVKTSSGTVGTLGAGELLTSAKHAKEDNLSVGSTVRVRDTKGEPVTYKVVGIYADNDVLRNFTYLLPNAAVDLFRQPNPVQAYVKLDDGVKVNTVKAQVDTVLADSPEVSVTDRSSFVEQQTKGLDSLIVIIQILLSLAIIIAVLGVINTLALSMIERTKELGLLRAVGMGRAQMMGMVTVESVVISVFGALLGIGVGVALGAAIVRALKDQGFNSFALPWGTMITYLIVAAVIGVVAAVIPAIRAARTDVLKAISYE
ncbi:FtsX-like permease family protein [Longispora sp. K20-0274]|uniref:ABC transporter permease n=1 Tax=Longispora sp. K20-0274 TaxID=3088255 RepID=UPI00399B0DA9